jgi:hypothetical protein
MIANAVVPGYGYPGTVYTVLDPNSSPWYIIIL